MADVPGDGHSEHGASLRALGRRYVRRTHAVRHQGTAQPSVLRYIYTDRNENTKAKSSLIFVATQHEQHIEVILLVASVNEP